MHDGDKLRPGYAHMGEINEACYSVDLNGLKATIQELDKYSNRMAAYIEEVDNIHCSLMHTGSGLEAEIRVVARLYAGLREQYEKIIRMRMSLAGIMEYYSHAENTITDMAYESVLCDSLISVDYINIEEYAEKMNMVLYR